MEEQIIHGVKLDVHRCKARQEEFKVTAAKLASLFKEPTQNQLGHEKTVACALFIPVYLSVNVHTWMINVYIQTMFRMG